MKNMLLNTYKKFKTNDDEFVVKTCQILRTNADNEIYFFLTPVRNFRTNKVIMRNLL